MPTSNNVIVLSKLKYRDNDLIVKCYTQQRGITNYLIRNAFKSKRSNTIAYYQLLSQLQIEENYKPNQSLQYIKEVKTSFVYKTVHTNVLKSAIALFIAEVLSSVLNEEEQNEILYNYIETTLQWLDSETKYANFHLLFLLKLTKYLGFHPETSRADEGIFNLQTGAFENNIEDEYTLIPSNNMVLKELLGMNFDEIHMLKLNSEQRQSFLNMLMLYFELHLGNFKKPKSLHIFNQVFS